MIAYVREHPLLFRALFAVYALALVVATHWPRLTVPGAARGSDKVLHFVAFFLWASSAYAAGFFGPALSRRSVARTTLLAAGYGLLDESLQLIPALERQASVGDGIVNLGGVAAAYALALILIRPKSDETVNSV